MDKATQTVDLTYWISTQLLKGKVLGNDFRTTAVSGGGANANRLDPDLSNNPDLTMVKSKRLSDGVGRRQPNRREDVIIVQHMLNDALVPSPQLVCDGRCGPRTAAAIESFQRSIGFAAPDGWIAPDGKTYQSLLRKARHYSFTELEFSPTVITPSNVFTRPRLESARVSNRGGPPPTGRYVLQVSPATPPGRISMVPQFTTNRTDLQIHGSGPIGSDGCIVVTSKTDRESLRSAVQQVPSGKATLHVLR